MYQAMYQLEISDMPAQGKKGWVRNHNTNQFLNAVSQSGYGSSARKLVFNLPDGIYQVQDANYGHRRINTYWLKIENGEAQEIEAPPKPEQIIAVALPELQGSEKQIAWAKDIREKCIKALQDANIPDVLIPHLLKFEESAKWWIENRMKVNSIFQPSGKRKIISYPQKEWIEFSEEHAHEGYGGEWCWRSPETKERDLIQGVGDELDEQVACLNPESQQWEIWHYTPSIY